MSRDFPAIAERYARGVVAGEILACRWVQLACQRHLDDLERQGSADFPYRFDPAAAAKICRFVELLPHTKGKWAQRKERLRLEPWQVFILAVVFGWRRANGTRRFRRAYSEIPRKNGKSAKSAGVGLYMLTADGEEGAEVYCGATTEKQAWEVFGPARKMVLKSPDLRSAAAIQVGARNLSVMKTGSRFEPIIGNPGDGASPSCAIIDEYHEHATDVQHDTMLTGMGAREQALLWVITTAGEDTAGPCYSLRTEVTEMLEGKVQNDELFGIMFTIDEGDDWTTEEALRKANPNYDVSVTGEWLRARLQEAIHYPRKQSTFKTKHLNIWVGAASPYFNLELWDRLGDRSLNPDAFTGAACFGGLDLAAKLDLTAKIKLFVREEGDSVCSRCRGTGQLQADPEDPGARRTIEAVPEEFRDELGGLEQCGRCAGSGVATEPHYYVFPRFYIPEARAKDPTNRHYAGWVEEGYLVATPGNITDYDEIEEDVLEDAERHSLQQLGFDPYNATQVATHLGEAGVLTVEVPQTVKHLSEPMKWIQALIVDGRIHHDGNPVMSWCIGNVTAQEDRNGNVFPRKERDDKKIDGAVALIIAVGRALEGDTEAGSVYEEEGLLVL